MERWQFLAYYLIVVYFHVCCARMYMQDNQCNIFSYVFVRHESTAENCHLIQDDNDKKSFATYSHRDNRAYNKKARYLLYDVNEGEGFNLRRDVYIRIANVVKKLNSQKSSDMEWILVLPPWGFLYHWERHDKLYWNWSSFFDLPSLRKWIPVLEFEEYLKVFGANVGSVYVLQNYIESWGENWQERYETSPCIQQQEHYLRNNEVHIPFFGLDINVESQAPTCVSFFGHASSVIPLLLSTENIALRSILLRRCEVLLHDEFGGKWFWAARRSMSFASHLKQEAITFLSRNGINVTCCTDENDFVVKTKGEPYLSVHLRRRDFVYARPDQVPSLADAASQIGKLLTKLMLKVVFIATDAPLEEFITLANHIKQRDSKYRVIKFDPSDTFFENWGDGGVAIVDQIICSYGSYFVGSYESTFSFRIQEEREIIGFSSETTFNRLCGDSSESHCDQPSKWHIVH